jgi:hypothetical protein
MTLLNQVLWILQMLEAGASRDEVLARFGDAEKAVALLLFMKEAELTVQSRTGDIMISPAGRDLLASYDLL